jgi:hypothetical protein
MLAYSERKNSSHGIEKNTTGLKILFLRLGLKTATKVESIAFLALARHHAENFIRTPKW